MPKLAYEYTFIMLLNNQHQQSPTDKNQTFPRDIKLKNTHIFIGELLIGNKSSSAMCFIKFSSIKSKENVVKILSGNNIHYSSITPYISRVYWLKDMYKTCYNKMPHEIRKHIKNKVHYTNSINSSFKACAKSILNENDNLDSLKSKLRSIGFLLLSNHERYLLKLIDEKT
jgi:hypothetical protein